MKTNYWLVLAATLSTGLMAQVATSAPPAVPMAAPAPATEAKSPVLAQTNAPAPQPASKKSAKKKKAPAPRKSAAAMAAEAALKVTPGPTLVAGNNVNVRGQATIRSEVIAKLTQGDTVTVLEEITLEKPAADEPVKWARIAFPTNGHIWLHTMFIDATNKTVLPNKLNLRAGPGENFSAVGLLHKGDTVKEIITQGDWMEIEAPASSYAFIAAQYLKQETPAAPAEPPPAPIAVAEASPPAMPLQETPVPSEPAIAPAPVTPAPAEAAAVPPVPAEPVAVAPEPAPATAEPAPEEPLPKRIVQHEGIVRNTWSIQAPTPYALVSPDTGETINYLYTTSTNLNMKRYKGLKIIVTGEEGLDARWRNTPVITIQKIHVVE
jgi:uncharacterized protein YgiM (DUF1202 family)